jgi:hypothetical protein
MAQNNSPIHQNEDGGELLLRRLWDYLWIFWLISQPPIRLDPRQVVTRISNASK